jgi:hypothetical protein
MRTRRSQWDMLGREIADHGGTGSTGNSEFTTGWERRRRSNLSLYFNEPLGN